MAEASQPPLLPVLCRWQQTSVHLCAAATAAVHEAAAVAVVAVVAVAVAVGAAGAVVATEAAKAVEAVEAAEAVAVAAAVPAWLMRPGLPPPDSGGRGDAPRSTPRTQSALRMSHTAPSEGEARAASEGRVLGSPPQRLRRRWHRLPH